MTISAIAVVLAASFTAGNSEIVVPPKPNAAVAFAAKEVAATVSAALGADVPTVNAPTPGRTSLVLGDCDLARKAGLDVSAFDRDEFAILAKGNLVFVAGRDSESVAFSSLHGRSERATLFGAYEFLHRFVGARSYFPGELGTVIPKRESIDVPEGKPLRVKPDYWCRRYGPKDGVVPAELVAGAGVKNEDAFKRLVKLRQRLATMTIPCCHGQLRSRFYRRFHETHPEYFVMGKDGKRHPTEASEAPFYQKEHLCHTSAVWDEIYEDAKAYLTGQPPEVRKIPKNGGSGYSSGPGVGGKYYDIMPHDGLGKCFCERCLAVCNHKNPQWATDLVWGNTVKLANRLKAEGVPGFVVQMAYHPYQNVPAIDIPDNVLVMVAQRGPWAPEKTKDGGDTDALVKAWVAKLGHKVWLWTYPDKIYERACPGIPQMSPRAWGRYFGRLGNWIEGGFAESESDRWLFNYLNYYVFSRVCWDSSTDVDALLDEHYRLMFGNGAPYVKKVFESLERKWTLEMVNGTKMGLLGPVAAVPDSFTTWTKVYSPAVLERYRELFGRAAAAVKPGSIEARRIDFMLREMLGPLFDAAKKSGFSGVSVKDAIAMRTKSDADVVWTDENIPAVASAWRTWPSNETSIGRIAEKGPVSKEPVELVSTGSNKYSSAWTKVPLEPSTRYRLSYFMKLDNVRTGSGGGVACSIKMKPSAILDDPEGEKNRAAVGGSTDWLYRELDFTTPPNLDKKTAAVLFRFHRALGRALFDGVRIERIKDVAK